VIFANKQSWTRVAQATDHASDLRE